MKEFNHIPVLMRQVLDWLSPVPDGRYIDATLGGGGHAEEIVRSGGKVLGIDQDLDAIEFVKKSKPNIDRIYWNTTIFKAAKVRIF